MEENNIRNPNLNKEIGKKISTEDKKQVQQLILKLVEEKAQESRFSDKHFDRETQKHKLLSGAEISLKEVRDNINSKARVYSPMFPIVYFRQIYRLLGLPESDADVFYRRREVAMFTREAIYGRFDKGVLMSLHVLNPYKGYIQREYKHFQFLTDDGLKRLEDIIKQAVEMMEECKTMHEFRMKWLQTYGVAYQSDAFKTI